MKKERLSHLISRIYATEDIELDCAEIQSLLPHFVEAEVEGADVGSVGPALRAHLTQCPDCNENYVNLRRIVALEAEGELPTAEETLAEMEPRRELTATASSD